jgi:hemerythrin-like metal-binding protein
MNLILHWKPEFSVKIKEIDQQHRKLFDLINLLYDASVRKEKEDILEQILTDLKDYAFVHFKDEEKYIVKATSSGYKDSQVHLSEHKYFINEVEMFREKYWLHDTGLLQRMIVFLQNWITNHILKSDKKYMEYLHDLQDM